MQDDTDGSKKTEKTTLSSDPCDSSSQATQKSKIKWTEALENHFYEAIEHIGSVHRATPKKILKFMNLKFLTKAHISSKLQKCRQTVKRDEESMRRPRMAMYPEFSSAGGYNYRQHPYNYNPRLGNRNLFNGQPGYGLGQSSSMMKNNAGLHDSLNYMNRRPTYDLSQTGSKLFPRRGNLWFQNGTLPQWRNIPGTSQAPRFGQYGATSNVLGMNYNPTTGTTGSSYAGVRTDENRDLVGLGGIGVNGNDNGSFGGIRVHGTGSDSGSLQGMSVHGNDHGSLEGIRGHCPGNGSLEGIRVHDNSNDSLGGIRVHGSGTGYVGEIGVHGTGNGNGSLGENFDMNWNFGNNNMSNHGSSTSVIPSVFSSFLDNKDQSQNSLIAQTGGVIPGLENSKIFNDHHDIDKIFSDINNSQFHHQNQHQGNLTGVNLEAPTAYPLEDINSWSFNDGTDNEELLNSLAANPDMYFPTHDMNITNQGNNHEETFNSLAANPEMHFPTQDMNITNQGTNHEETFNSLAANPEMHFPTQDMNITNQDHDNDEDIMNYLSSILT
ncbi:uncharacterized protein LOC108807838 isoform X2 [Raphanus sativus]|nr:uncharacterized protein LOC108807838 isoform X2 [Raphanus sativus]